MSTSEKEQKGLYVPYNKRRAMGAKLDGQSLQAKGDTNPISKPKGGLSGAKKK